MSVNVIIDSPARNSDLIYKTGYYCLDPFIFIEVGDKKIGFLPSTEYEKAKKKSALDEIYNLTGELQKISETKKYPLMKSSVALDFLIKNEISEIFVPSNFPLIEADNLRNNGVNIYTREEPFYSERISKNQKEIEYIGENSRKNVLVMDMVKNILSESSVTNDKRLKHKGEILTVKKLQDYIYKSFVEYDLYADTVITAIGDQGCDPHETGYGDVIANASIIVDIYPRSRKNLYYTDMTRTFCKGKASDELKKIYDAVFTCQKMVFDKICSRVSGKSIHLFAIDYFESKGFKSGQINGVLQGFFHGTGHGLGLECHEPP
ncbi:MAG TPA: M24 family metallopeptidase, partial [Spirochaetota bacterium]|nr:M24 family metallopeptidase [Spirochaetota bacterium]